MARESWRGRSVDRGGPLTEPEMPGSPYGWRIGGLAAGVLGLLGLVLPVVELGVSAVGVQFATTTLTVWELADVAETAGHDPTNVYLLIAVIAIGSVVALLGAARSSRLAAIGVLLQVGGVGYLLYSLSFGRRAFLGIEATVNPEIGLFALLLAAGIGLLSLVL